MIQTLKRTAKRALRGPGLVERAARLLAGTAAPVVLDVGANTGQTAREVLSILPTARLTCFEPSPQTFPGLAKEFAGRATVEQLALSDQSGELKFHIDPNWPVNDSLLAPKHPGCRTVTVPALTLDTYCTQHGITRIDFLKVDTQGHDLAVLRGAAGLFAAGAVRVFSCELVLAAMYEGQSRGSDLFAFAESHGFRLDGVIEQDRWNDRLAGVDLLFRPV